MSLGPSIDASLTAAQCARHVIVEINDQMPRTLGDTFLHVSRVDAFVETSHPLAEYPQHEVTDLHRAIARHVAALIPDGATIQTGIGGIPEAVLGLLRDHKDLGIHSEMVPDGVDRADPGRRDQQRAQDHPPAQGDRRLRAGHASGCSISSTTTRSSNSTARPTANDPFVIAQNDRMVAINSAIEVDLTGQVCADSMGQTLYSGIGGQVDFLRGAARSKGGLPIITLPSTAKNGTVSRIVPTAAAGRRRGDLARRRALRGHRARRGLPARQDPAAARRSADPGRRPEVPRRAGSARP